MSVLDEPMLPEDEAARELKVKPQHWGPGAIAAKARSTSKSASWSFIDLQTSEHTSPAASCGQRRRCDEALPLLPRF